MMRTQSVSRKQREQNDNQKVQMFLSLKKEPIEILQERAREQGLDDSGTVTDLARRLTNATSVEQSVFGPQAFALKSKEDAEAQQFMRRANARILPQDLEGRVIKQKLRKRPFRFTDKNGAEYVAECPFVELKNETALMILDRGWIYPLENQRQLVAEMRKDITKFSCHLIRKKTPTDGRFYLMMHVERKK